MYEGTIVRTGGAMPARDSDPCVSRIDGLRALNWGEIAARLEASRDLRRMLAVRHTAGAGSFNLASARHLAAQGDGKPVVNPIALANGKIACGMDDTALGNMLSGDRGRE